MSKKLSVDLTLNAQGFKQGINEAKGATAEYTNATRDLKKETEAYLQSMGSLKKQFGAAKKEAQNLAVQFAALSDAEKKSEFGQELAESLQIAIEKAAELQDVMSDTNDAIKNAASDTAGLDALKESLEVGKDLTMAYAGAVAKFTGDEKALKDVIATLAMVQGGYNAVIKVTNMLQKNSATMIALQRSGVLSLAQAEKISAAATNAATVATKGLGIAMKALPYVAVASGVLYLGKKFVDYMSGANKAVKETKNIEEELTGVKKTLNDVANTFNGSYARALGKTLGTYKQLQNQYKSLSTEHEKTKWIKENTDKLNDLGISITSVNDADRILIKQSKDVVESFKLRAEAAAEAAKLQELYTKRIEAKTEAIKRANKKQIKAGEQVQDGDVDRFGLQEGDYKTYKHTVGMFYTDAGAMKAQKALIENNIRSYTAEIDAEIKASADRLAEAEAKYDEALGNLGLGNNNHHNGPDLTQEQITQLQKLQNEVKKYETAIQNIKNPISEEGIEELDKYKKLLAEASKNVINYKIAIGVAVNKEEEDKALYEIDKSIKELNKQKATINIDTEEGQRKAKELQDKINELERQKLDLYISVGVAVDKEEANNQIKAIENEISDINKKKIEIEASVNASVDLEKINAEMDEISNKKKEIEFSFDINSDEAQKQIAELDKRFEQLQNIKIEITTNAEQSAKQLEDLNKQTDELARKKLNYQIAIGAYIPKNEVEDAIKDISNEIKQLDDQKATIDVNTEEGKKKAKELQAIIDKLTGLQNTYTVYIDVTYPKDPVEAYEKELKSQLDKAAKDYKLAKINGDEAAAQVAADIYKTVQGKLDELKIDVKPKADVSEVDNILKELNTNEPKYDFNFLPDNFREQADEMLDRLDQLTDARKKWQDIIDRNENADEVAKANEALAKTKAEYDDLTDACQRFNEASAQIKEREKEFESFKNTIQSVSDVVGSIDSVVSSIESMTNAFEEGANAWEQFMSIVQVAMSVLNAVTTIMEIVNTLQEISNASKAVGASTVEKEAIAHGANATAQIADAAATEGMAAAAGVAIAPTIALSKAMEKLAAANIFAAHSGIPFVGPALAAGFVTMMEGILETVGTFEKGGVIPGSSFTGDKLLARVNSGERVLTAKQNENLEKIANGVGYYQDSGQPSTIHFKLVGEDIYGSLKNYKNIHRIK